VLPKEFWRREPADTERNHNGHSVEAGSWFTAVSLAHASRLMSQRRLREGTRSGEVATPGWVHAPDRMATTGMDAHPTLGLASHSPERRQSDQGKGVRPRTERVGTILGQRRRRCSEGWAGGSWHQALWVGQRREGPRWGAETVVPSRAASRAEVAGLGVMELRPLRLALGSDRRPSDRLVREEGGGSRRTSPAV
jgi:hypothetical protein